MLVLAREKFEEIVIIIPDGRKIIVTMCQSSQDKGKIGIEADKDIAIHRKEVWEKICAKNNLSGG